MQTLLEKFTSFQTALQKQYDPAEASEIAKMWFTDMLDTNFSWLTRNWQQPVAENDSGKVDQALHRLLAGEPIQHVLGYAWFYGEKYLVTRDVLIPRRETEELVHLVLEREKGNPRTEIADIGCGSGCISISLQKNLPGSDVTGIDINPRALAVSKQNAKNILGENSSISFLLGDIRLPEQQGKLPLCDVIVSNPPYITPEEKKDMLPLVLDNEPHTALFVPQDQPLLFYEAIATCAQLKLKPSGRLYLEINEAFGMETAKMLEANGFSVVEVLKDMQGKDRMIYAIKPA